MWVGYQQYRLDTLNGAITHRTEHNTQVLPIGLRSTQLPSDIYRIISNSSTPLLNNGTYTLRSLPLTPLALLPSNQFINLSLYMDKLIGESWSIFQIFFNEIALMLTAIRSDKQDLINISIICLHIYVYVQIYYKYMYT